MIPERNKALFLERIADGMTLEEACTASQVSRRSAFRFMRTDPDFRSRYEDLVFWRRKSEQDAERKRAEDGMARLKAMITKRK